MSSTSDYNTGAWGSRTTGTIVYGTTLVRVTSSSSPPPVCIRYFFIAASSHFSSTSTTGFSSWPPEGISTYDYYTASCRNDTNANIRFANNTYLPLRVPSMTIYSIDHVKKDTHLRYPWRIGRKVLQNVQISVGSTSARVNDRTKQYLVVVSEPKHLGRKNSVPELEKASQV